MRIQKGDKGNIDFEKPIELTDKQKELLLGFLRKMFYHVEEKSVDSLGRERIGQKTFAREWEDEEYELLLKIDENNNAVSRKLGRSWMSIEMRRLYYIPQMIEYAKKKGQDIYKTDIKQLVKQFLQEHKDEILKRKGEKKERRDLLKDLLNQRDSLMRDIPKHEQVGVKVGLMTIEQVEKMKETLEEVKERIKELEEDKI